MLALFIVHGDPIPIGGTDHPQDASKKSTSKRQGIHSIRAPHMLDPALVTSLLAKYH